MHKGISGATFTLQDSGRGSSAVDQCTPETHGRKAGKPLKDAATNRGRKLCSEGFWSLLINNELKCKYFK